MRDYSGSLVAALRAAYEIWRHRLPWDGAMTLAKALLRYPPAQQLTMIRNSRRYRRLEVCQALVEVSHSARHDRPGAMVAAARSAVAVAESLPPTVPTCVAMDARAEAWATLGNAERVAGDYRAAEAASHRALQLIPLGSADPLAEARVLTLRAALRTDQGRYPEALSLYWEAYRRYHEVQELQHAGCVLVSLGRTYAQSGNHGRAIQCLLDAIERMNIREEPALVLSAVHNLATCLNDSGHPDEALKVLCSARPLYSGGSLIVLRLQWLEARIATNLGRLDSAIELHDLNRRAFVQRGMAHEAALASLELAELHARLQEWDAIRRLVEEMYPVFLSRDLHTEALASLLLLVDSVRGQGGRAERYAEFLRLVRAAKASLQDGSERRKA